MQTPSKIIVVRREGATSTLRIELAANPALEFSSLGDLRDLGTFEDPVAEAGLESGFFQEIWSLVTPEGDNDQSRLEQLRRVGTSLWDRMPDPFRQYCWEELFDQSEPSLLFWTDALHIPWELVWPTTEDGQPTDLTSIFGLAFSMGRWPIRRTDLPDKVGGQSGVSVLTPLVNNPAAVSSDERDGIVKEAGFVESSFGATWIDTVSKQTLLDEVELGRSILHIRTHGGASAQESSIVVDPDDDGNFKVYPDDLRELYQCAGPVLEPTMVFLNACQTGWQIGYLSPMGEGGRWSYALTEGGSRAIILPYWFVNTNYCTESAETFYNRAQAGDTLGEAVRSIRSLVHEGDDGISSFDFLCYTLVGNPAASIDLPLNGQ